MTSRTTSIVIAALVLGSSAVRTDALCDALKAIATAVGDTPRFASITRSGGLDAPDGAPGTIVPPGFDSCIVQNVPGVASHYSCRAVLANGSATALAAATLVCLRGLPHSDKSGIGRDVSPNENVRPLASVSIDANGVDLVFDAPPGADTSPPAGMFVPPQK